MKKRFLATFLSLSMAFSLAACGGGTDNTDNQNENANTETENSNENDSTQSTKIKVGLICIGDENDQGYTYNFIRGRDDATKALADKGIEVEWVTKWNVGEDSTCEDANRELAEEGCQLIINNSFDFEEFMLKVAPDYPEIQFVACTNQESWHDDLENTHNVFANIYEGHYLAGVVAGMKLQEMIDNGEITEDEAVMGYVGSFAYAEVISGYTAYFLGARSVCPSVTMKVQFVSSWSDATAEQNAAVALADMGCKMISQGSDNSTPATAAQAAGVYHTGYNNDMISIAPQASLVSTRIDWSPYFQYAIEAVATGEKFAQDWCRGMDIGAVVLTPLNQDLIAEGTEEKVAEVEQAIINGSLQVFDTSTFTVRGERVKGSFALDTDGDFTPDSEEAVFDGAYHESYFQSAPYFALEVDGIEMLSGNN